MKKVITAGILIVSIFALSSLIRYTHAEGDPNPPGSPAWCADHCKPDLENNACNQTSTYKSPDCCKDVEASGDPGACSWPDRGYCTDNQCSTIPEDTNRQRCGGPKHGWCDLCTENHCPGFGSPPTPIPTSTPLPPTPTREPTPVPTAKPTFTPPPQLLPTEPLVPSLPPPTVTPLIESPVILPTEKTFDIPTSSLPENYQSPSFSIPLIQIPTLPMVCTSTAVRPDPIMYLFDKIKYYDRELENTLNIRLLLIYHFIKTKIEQYPINPSK